MSKTVKKVDNMSIRKINLWQYWKEMHDFSPIDIDFSTFRHRGVRVVVFNVGFEVTF